jgi:hypothetical protein
MNNSNTTKSEKDNKAEGRCTTSPDTESKCSSKEIMPTFKHIADDTGKEVSAAGHDIKVATKEICASSEKAVLQVADKALRATSLAAARASRSVRRKMNP